MMGHFKVGASGLLLLLCLSFCGAATPVPQVQGPIQATVEGQLDVPMSMIGGGLDGASVSLSGAAGMMHVTQVAIDGTFAFHGVQPGAYIMDVIAGTLAYPQVSVMVTKRSGKVRVDATDGSQDPGIPIQLEPKMDMNFFTPRQSYSLVSMAMQNPMILMMVVMGGITMLMPKQEMENATEMLKTDDGSPAGFWDVWNKLKEDMADPEGAAARQAQGQVQGQGQGGAQGGQQQKQAQGQGHGQPQQQLPTEARKRRK